MPVQTFTKREDIPAELADKVIEAKDGSFYHFADEDNAALKGSLMEEREKREKAEKLVSKTAAELKRLEVEAKQRMAGLTEDQIKALREDVRRDVETEFAPLKEKAATADQLAADLRALRLNDRIKAAMSAAKVRGERLEALFKLTADRYDLTADGKPMVSAAPGVAIDKYVTETLKAEFPEFFEGTKASGSNAPGSTGDTGTQKPATGLDPVARLTAARERGLAA